MENLLAASGPQNISNDIPVNTVGQLGNNATAPATQLSNVISIFIGVITMIIFIYFFFTLVAGAIRIISSGQDKAAFEEGRKKITMGFVGITIAIGLLLFIDLLGDVFGVGNRLLDIGAMVDIFRGLILL